MIMRAMPTLSIFTTSKKTNFNVTKRFPKALHKVRKSLTIHTHIRRQGIVLIGQRDHTILLMKPTFVNNSIRPLSRPLNTAFKAFSTWHGCMNRFKVNRSQTHKRLPWCHCAYIYQVIDICAVTPKKIFFIIISKRARQLRRQLRAGALHVISYKRNSLLRGCQPAKVENLFIARTYRARV